ncbi:IS5 family transposase (plasmid) [Rhizobium sp. RCAM05350]|nr:IS5 family transposase [Rhizobium sp. RCAM05350]
MPHKFNDARRPMLPRQLHRVTNWTEYNEALRRRGDPTIWFEDGVADLWSAPRRLTQGDQARYSDIAIEMCLALRLVFGLPLRQTQGFVRSIAQLTGGSISAPCFSTLSRRGAVLKTGIRKRPPTDEPVHLVVDSTGLKVFGAGEWLEEKHETRGTRRSWRKLQLGLDLLSGEILCADLTLESIGDTTALPELLGQIDAPVALFIANGAYDGVPVSDLVEARFGDQVVIIIPPPKNAVPSVNAAHNPTPRDRHIDVIATHGRMGWQKSSGDNQRSRIEARMGRCKTVIGPKLKARTLANQRTEAAIGVSILNRMNRLGPAELERVA